MILNVQHRDVSPLAPLETGQVCISKVDTHNKDSRILGR